MNKKIYIPVIALVLLVIVIQLIIHASDAAYYLTQLTMSAYYVLVVIGLCLLMGYAGQISLGQAGFFAIGGYISAVLTTYNLLPYSDSGIIKFFSKLRMVIERQDLYGNRLLSFSPWVGFFAAVAITVIIALLIGIPVLKLKGHYLAMATLGFGLIIYRIVLGTAIFGEADGVSDVPGFVLIPACALEVNGSISLRIQNYYIAWFIVILGMIISVNLIHSRVGRALRSIHGSEDAANAMGVNISKYKLYTFILSAVLAAIGGVFLTHYNGSIGPSEATSMKSIRYVAIVAVGGMANIWGTLIMGVLLNFLSLRGYFGTYDDAVFGAIFIIIMLFAPQGLLKISQLQKICTYFKSRNKGHERASP